MRSAGTSIGLGGLSLVTMLGAAGGALNAWLCMVRLPVPVGDNPGFSWTVVPWGAVHGAVLAIVPVSAAVIVSTWKPGYRYSLAPLVAWVAGYLSWIPLDHSVFQANWGVILFLWPREHGEWWKPLPVFGAVSGIYFLFLTARGFQRGMAQHMAFGACAGAMGSLWWWIAAKPWYFALIHGTAWGVLVGLGVHGAVTLRMIGKPRFNGAQGDTES